MRLRALSAHALVGVLSAACRSSPSPAPSTASPSDASVIADTSAARRVFEGNIDAIHKRDRARYLSYYLHTDRLARNGPTGLELGFADWPARRDTTWPDTLVARDLRLVPIAPGVVYGTYHYRVTQDGATSEGISERVFVRTPDGWKIAMSTAFGLPAGASPPPVAIIGGTLVNPYAPPVPNAAVVVRNGRIVCAGALGPQCAPPGGVELVRADGGFVAPGMIDAHVHYSQTGWVDGRPDALDVRGEYPYDSVVGALAEHPDRFDRAYLCSGVTGVFDVGGYPWTIALARSHDTALDAPHVGAAGPLLSTVDHWLNLPTARQFVFTKDDSTTRAAVRAQAALGADAIKVWYVHPASAHRRMRPLLFAAADEAQRAGLPLIVHATELARAKEALESGAAVLVHSVSPEEIDDELVALAKQREAIVVPTLTVWEGYRDVYLGRSPASRYLLDCVDPATRTKLERVLPESARASGAAAAEGFVTLIRAAERNLRRLRAGGVAIAMGTDAGNPGTAHGPSVYREMEAMQEAGMPATEVFASATLIAARATGREKEVGSLEPGKIADLVVFDADPTADIANARRVRMVMRGGALYGQVELLPRAQPPRQADGRGRADR